ncbi:teichoic acid biosynthesis protein C [Kineosporia sp. R_H_3]|uniref:phage baseplate protein n=1 Tax=Kineosporia sp. R_H_3 TaxID=1961848 RepID=UPI000B4ADDD2|nr:teichoic acid biosynthesis protein C [Kineosporia sp. R_H_3]
MDHLLSRRLLLRAGGAAGAAALLGGLTPSPASAVSSTGLFDLSLPSYEFIRSKALGDNTVLQSFAFDNVHDHIYFAQVTDGTDKSLGHLTITKTNLDGVVLGTCFLRGFGHGTQIAVQPSGTGAYVWVEASADADGYGEKLARFLFVSGRTLTGSSSAVEIYDPRPTGRNKSIAIDTKNGRVAIRYKIDGESTTHYDLFSLSKFAAHDYSGALESLALPNVGMGTFQGFTTYGSYLYLLSGDAYDDGYGDPYDGLIAGGARSAGNTFIRAVSWATGAGANSPVRTTAGQTLYYREPEGMAVRINDAGEAKLCFGFASGTAGARRASIYYKV